MKKRRPRDLLVSPPEWQAARKRAIALYDPICVICGGPIDMDGKPFEPMSCEVDHKVPLSRGGHPTAIENLQLSHSKCNRNKGSKMDSDYEGMDSKQPFPISNNW